MLLAFWRWPHKLWRLSISSLQCDPTTRSIFTITMVPSAGSGPQQLEIKSFSVWALQIPCMYITRFIIKDFFLIWCGRSWPACTKCWLQIQHIGVKLENNCKRVPNFTNVECWLRVNSCSKVTKSHGKPFHRSTVHNLQP